MDDLGIPPFQDTSISPQSTLVIGLKKPTSLPMGPHPALVEFSHLFYGRGSGSIFSCRACATGEGLMVTPAQMEGGDALGICHLAHGWMAQGCFLWESHRDGM